MMEAANTSEKSVNLHKATRRYKSEHSNIHGSRCLRYPVQQDFKIRQCIECGELEEEFE
jgi:hypothetical protein